MTGAREGDLRTGILLLAALAAACAQTQAERPVSWAGIAGAPRPPPDEVVFYGDDPQQFGELRLPEGGGPFPVVVLLHGGCWLSRYDLGYMAGVAADLAANGMAVWSLEYRRVGDDGGGWPGTFRDVAAGVGHLEWLARSYPLDLDRVVLTGHSAGGHLSLWLVSRGRLPQAPGPDTHDPPEVKGVVTLAGITDLARYSQGPGGCNRAVEPLMGGTPAQVPERYDQADPMRLLPSGVPTRLIQGAADPIVPVEQATRFAEAATTAGDDAIPLVVEGEGHFDVVDPTSRSWETARRAIEEMLSR